MNLYPHLITSIGNIQSTKLSQDRELPVTQIVDFVGLKLANNESINLNFICTHNSRRSQFAQAWAKVAATYYKIPINSYSGGVEVTEFNERAVNTLKNQGFKIEASGKTNPIYKVHFSPDAEPLTMYSKLYNDLSNPSENFAAIMTCSDADENCPVVLGAESRIALRYNDPKEFDGTPEEEAKYAERSLQIAAEMFYIFRQTLS